MSDRAPVARFEPRLMAVARAVRRAGGRAMVVGGYVRDLLRGQPSKDIDVEVLGVPADALRRLLAAHGEVVAVGRAFGVFRLKGLDVDFALPRSHSRQDGNDMEVDADPSLDFAAAARRRDLTINAMGLDPLSKELVDPHGGRADLEARRLRATDPGSFGDDPLRGLRVAQMAARFEMQVDPALRELCRGLPLERVAAERIFQEFRKLLLRAARPSIGLECLRECGLLRFFPPLEALVGVPQDPEWHPEGDVWIHTAMVVDEAARLRRNDGGDEVLMFAALCHDFGKPATTEVGTRIRSLAHDVQGVAPSREFLTAMRAPHATVDAVCALVRHHLAPALYVANGAGARAYRKLARRLHLAGTSIEMLERVARSDHLGRTTADARARCFAAGDTFLQMARSCEVVQAPRRDAVLGRHLLARGFSPGPQLGPVLARCRELQDETGWEDPQAILDAVLANGEDPTGGS